MGDEINVLDIQFLYGHLWQIDLKNENTREQIRFFIENNELQERMQQAIATWNTRQKEESR